MHIYTSCHAGPSIQLQDLRLASALLRAQGLRHPWPRNSKFVIRFITNVLFGRVRLDDPKPAAAKLEAMVIGSRKMKEHARYLGKISWRRRSGASANRERNYSNLGYRTLKL